MKKLLFITPEDAEYGFSMAGAAQRVIKPGELAATLGQAMSESEGVALVAVDERLVAEGLGEQELEEMRKAFAGVLVVLPAPGARMHAAPDYAAELIRRTIGYHMRLTL